MDDISLQVLEKMKNNSDNSPNIPDTIPQFLDSLRNRDIVIYPAGALGRLLGKTLSEYGITISCFIDREFESIGSVQNIPVREPSTLSKMDEKSLVLIAANRPSLLNTLSEVVREYNLNIAILDGFSVNRLLRYSLCERKLQRKETFDLIICENCGYEGRGCPICLEYLKAVAPGDRSDEDWRSKSFDWFGYIVGQRCTMNCKHCCESIPYLPNPRFVSCEKIISDIEKVANSSLFLNFVEFIGGEPFLYPEFEKLLIESLKIENVGYIKSFTNGTITPKDSLCEILKNPRIMLQLSNYERTLTGVLKVNFLRTKQKLDNWGIHYVYAPNTEWRDFSSFELHRDPVHSLEEIFQCCPLAGCHRLYDGMLYRCPHQYAGVELGKLKKLPIESIDIYQFDQVELGKEIEKFENVPFIDACRFCTMPFDAIVVPPGEQIYKGEMK